jgi:hypothetical protein
MVGSSDKSTISQLAEKFLSFYEIWILLSYSQQSVIEPRRDLGNLSAVAHSICLKNENFSQCIQ